MLFDQSVILSKDMHNIAKQYLQATMEVKFFEREVPYKSLSRGVETMDA